MLKKELNQSSKKIIRKNKLEKDIRNRFCENEQDKIILFTNPKFFSGMKIEKINPNHIAIIWGYRKRKYRKIKGSNWVKIAKIQFGEFALFIGNYVSDRIIYLVDYSILMLNKVGFAVLVFYILMGLIYSGLCLKLGRY